MRPQGSTRPPKWPFLAGDAVLLLVAFVIGFVGERPLTETSIILIFTCAFIGTGLAVMPFIMDSVSARHEDLIEARRQLEGLAQKLAESADIIGTVAGQLEELNDATVKAIHMAESLPYKMQEKVGELAQLVQQGDDEEKEAMAAELEELRDSESRHFEASIDKARATLDAAVKRVESAEKSLSAATAALAQAKPAPVPVATETPAPAPAPSPAPAAPPPAEPTAKHHPKPKHTKESPPEAEPAKEKPPAPAATEPESNGHEAPRHHATAKPVKHDKPAPKAEARPEPEPPAEKEPAHKESPQPAPRKKAAPKPPPDEILPGLDPVVVRDEDADGEDGAAAKTSDGSTRLLVTAYIGIGNKVFVRGEGPGLDPEKGQAMEFVSIGKWLWQTPDATAPITVQLYKNDEVKAMGDDITIDPGHHVEVTPVFRDPNPF